jgi:hypothetical protein
MYMSPRAIALERLAGDPAGPAEVLDSDISGHNNPGARSRRPVVREVIVSLARTGEFDTRGSP